MPGIINLLCRFDEQYPLGGIHFIWSDSRGNGISRFKFARICIMHLNQSGVMHLSHKLTSTSFLSVPLAFKDKRSWRSCCSGVWNKCSFFFLSFFFNNSSCTGISWIRLWWIQKLGPTETGLCCSSGRARGPSSSSSSCPTKTTPSPTATSSWRNWRDSTLISKASMLSGGGKSIFFFLVSKHLGNALFFWCFFFAEI